MRAGDFVFVAEGPHARGVNIDRSGDDNSALGGFGGADVGVSNAAGAYENSAINFAHDGTLVAVRERAVKRDIRLKRAGRGIAGKA